MPNWTEEQIRAIETDTNLIVSAAAGSGKTAVLVERIKRKLLPDSEGNYMPVDRLLVVTFARDAAQEMQTRLGKVLNEAYAVEKDKVVRKILKEQLKKLVFADICTIDSFCIHFVKQNFHLLGIDPKFRIFDESESSIYKTECLDEYFDLLYEKKDEDFFLLTDIYSKGYDDREVGELITSVYDFTRSLPDPDLWLEIHAEDYSTFSDGYFCATVEKNFNDGAKYALISIKKMMESYKLKVGTDDENALSSYGFTDLWTVFKSDIEILDKPVFEWDDIYKISQSFSQVKKSSSKKPEAVVQKEFIDLRREILAPIFEAFSIVKMPVEQADKLYSEKLYPHAKAISKLTKGFADYIYSKKTKDGKYDFNDLEHMTLNLLRENDDIRNTLSEKYLEILMDEYQDTNALQEEIFTLVSNGKNRFMVGDMKQSIYRFRSSDPFIFRNKNELYSNNPEAGNRVVLSKNFRSRNGVLQSINCVFENIMSYNVGEIDYNDEQALHYGNHDFDTVYPENDYTSEFHLIEGEARSDDEELMSDRELEAEFVAEKIKKMIDGGWQVFDHGKFRNAEAGDFAILMNSVKSDSTLFIEALRKRGLNGYSEDKEFLEKTEIKLILSFVSVVNNPYNDISLVSVMRSPVYRFTDEELALIRLCSFGEFWKSVCEKSKEDSPLGAKCKAFIDDINKWRELSRFMSAERLVWRIMTESSLYDMCGILYGGDVALANLRLFTERTRALSENRIATLNDLEVYMTNLLKTDGLGSATAGFNGVPVMTIHKSKGLEFPVVFVCGVGKRIISDGNSGIVNLHKDRGFGINNINSKEFYSLPTVNRSVIANIKNKEGISEQLRKLYVGLTRAKEKLIVTAVVGAKKDGSTFDFTDTPVCEKNIEKASSFAKIMAPAIKQYGGKLWRYNEYQSGTISFETAEISEEIAETVDNTVAKEQVSSAFEKFIRITEPASVSTKVSVSEMKNSDGFSSKLQKYPAFMNKGGGAAFGTDIHNVMENIKLISDMSEEHIKNEVLRILGTDSSIAEEKIYGFFESTLGRRMLASKKIVREAEFETTIPAFADNGSEIKNETMLLQGVVDLYFEESDGFVLVDYKTDKCTQIYELVEKYGVQLKWYKYAMDKLLHKKVKNVYIYSFHKNTFIELSELID